MGPIRFLARSAAHHPRDIIHFDVIFPLLQELHQWNALLKLVKVKSHAGRQRNEMADELADQGCASDEEPVLPGQQKYGSLLLRVSTSMRNLREDENMGHRLPRDGAPNKALLKSVIAINKMQAAKLRGYLVQTLVLCGRT